MRPIDADALRRALDEVGGCGASPGSWDAGWDDAIAEAIRLLNQAPTLPGKEEEK